MGEVSMGEVSAVAVSTGEAFVVANSVQCEADTCSAAAVSTGVAFAVTVSAVAFVVAVLMAVITDSLMMSSSSTTSAFRGGGAGAIRTDITVTAITRTITMDTAGTVTTMTAVMDTAMAADQGICGGGDKRATAFGIRLVARAFRYARSEEHTSELQSRRDIVCGLLLEQKNRI